jgi:hypothetical protein
MIPPRLQKIYKRVLVEGFGLSDDHDIDDLSEEQERDIWFTEGPMGHYMGHIILTPEGQKIIDIMGNVTYEE